MAAENERNKRELEDMQKKREEDRKEIEAATSGIMSSIGRGIDIATGWIASWF